jgi:hypothetical protein
MILARFIPNVERMPNVQIEGQAASGLSLSNVGLNEAAIAEKSPLLI